MIRPDFAYKAVFEGFRPLSQWLSLKVIEGPPLSQQIQDQASPGMGSFSAHVGIA